MSQGNDAFNGSPQHQSCGHGVVVLKNIYIYIYIYIYYIAVVLAGPSCLERTLLVSLGDVKTMSGSFVAVERCGHLSPGHGIHTEPEGNPYHSGQHCKVSQ